MNTSNQRIIDSNQQIILFDGVCKLCNGWAQFIIKYDKNKKFKLCTVQSETGTHILSHFGLNTTDYDTMVLVKNKQSYLRSDAFFQVVKQLGYPWKAVVIFSAVPKFMRDALYNFVALNRYRIFGRYSHCLLPTSDNEERFL